MNTKQNSKTKLGVRAYCWLRSLHTREEGFVSAEHIGYAVAGLIIIGGIAGVFLPGIKTVVTDLLAKIGVGGGP